MWGGRLSSRLLLMGVVLLRGRGGMVRVIIIRCRSMVRRVLLLLVVVVVVSALVLAVGLAVRSRWTRCCGRINTWWRGWWRAWGGVCWG
jgi:hypothetical protein